MHNQDDHDRDERDHRHEELDAEYKLGLDQLKIVTLDSDLFSPASSFGPQGCLPPDE